jgi:hypothetical protein
MRSLAAEICSSELTTSTSRDIVAYGRNAHTMTLPLCFSPKFRQHRAHDGTHLNNITTTEPQQVDEGGCWSTKNERKEKGELIGAVVATKRLHRML